jgi:glycosyltransferase involved in cell wall biosynthesis
MKVAQIAPLYEAVPPKLYGGTERVVSYLTEELVRRGHAVTLFASGDSITGAELAAPVPTALRLDPRVRDPLPHFAIMLDAVRRRSAEFDVLHFHIDILQFPLFRDIAAATLTTLHGRQDLPDLPPLYRAFAEMPLVSISHAQRAPLPPLNWVATVHHGLPRDLYAFAPEGADGYLAFLGRISPEKRPDRAIEIAIRAGIALKIAAKVDAVDRAYFEERIRPLLAHPLVEFIGEIGEREKGAFLGGARALLFPIDWPEPFGLVAIEAMACGTPVVAFRCGAAPEVIDPGLTGFVVDTLDDAVAAVARIGTLDRARVRAAFERRFSVERMADDYLAAYASLAEPATAAAPGGSLADVA